MLTDELATLRAELAAVRAVLAGDGWIVDWVLRFGEQERGESQEIATTSWNHIVRYFAAVRTLLAAAISEEEGG